MKIVSQNKCFDGEQFIYSHASSALGCDMRFGIYLPPHQHKAPMPVLYWLSGLTCTEENFILKAGAQRVASALGIILITPDTSPRGLNIPGDSASYDLGTGAGFYVNATESPWQQYQMYQYIVQELPDLIAANFEIDKNHQGIFGHSMGGHGALMIAIKNPDTYRSVSAFAPIASPTQCMWGQKAFSAYLGDNKTLWATYDAIALIKQHGFNKEILVDQGTADQFLETQLKPQLLQAACRERKVKLTLRMQPGYDHSYFFIATFIEDHLRFHAKNLSS